MDLGITEQTDLALDVDGDQVDDAEVDDESLDSDDDDKYMKYHGINASP